MVQITERVIGLVRAKALKTAADHELQHRVRTLLCLIEVIARRTRAETLPTAPQPSGQTGFGRMFMDSIAPAQLGGTATREIPADGLHYVLTVANRTLPV